MDNLRLARLRRGWSQAALAAAAGMRPTTIARLELGRATPRPATVGRLCAVLAVSVDELLTAAELAAATRPRTAERAQAREAGPGGCAACAQPLTSDDWRHLAAGGRVHRQCWKAQSPRPALAACCQGGPCGVRGS